MKTFLLFVTIGLLLYRIIKTPSMLNEKIYYEDLEKSIEKTQQNLRFFNQDFADKVFNISAWVVIITYGLVGIYYVTIGTYMNITSFSILTLLQLVTVIINSYKQKFSLNIADQAFHKWLFLINVVLDYIYYPYAIYLLVR
jgi:hypothetical protein